MLILLDRDGVLLVDNGPAPKPSQIECMPGMAACLQTWLKQGHRLALVTNQGAIGLGQTTFTEVDAVHQSMRRALGVSEAALPAFVSPYHPKATMPPFRGPHPDRKPGPGLLLQAMRQTRIPPWRSLMIGDRERDCVAGRSARCAHVIWFDSGAEADHVAPSLYDFRVDSSDALADLPCFCGEAKP